MAAGRCYRMRTQIATNNLLQLGYWKDTDFELVIFDLSHVSFTFTQEQTCTWNNWSKYFDERQLSITTISIYTY
jgi:hypothetical protein